MVSPSGSLKQQHKRIINSLNSFDKSLSADPVTMPWWEMLMGARALENECNSHSYLILQYHAELGPRHWILDKVLTIILTKTCHAEHLAKAMSRVARRNLAAPYRCDGAATREELVQLAKNIRAALEFEEIIAYQLLDVLKNHPTPSTPDNSTGDVERKLHLHLLC